MTRARLDRSPLRPIRTPVRPVRWIGLLALVIGVAGAGCAPDAGPVPMTRLWIEPHVWQVADASEARPSMVRIGDETRPGLTMNSGEAASTTIVVPATRPCWLDLEIGVVDAAEPTTVEVIVELGGEVVVRRNLQPDPSFAEIRVDLATFQGQSTSLSIVAKADGARVVLANPRIQAKEIYDSRQLHQVLVVLPPDTLDKLLAAPDQFPTFARLAGRSVWLENVVGAAGAGGVAEVLWPALGGALFGADRELHGFPLGGVEALSEGFDSCQVVDAWDPEANPSGARRLFLLQGRSRPHPMTLALQSQATASEVDAGLARLVEQMDLHGTLDRALFVLATGSDAPGQPGRALVYPPELSRGFACVATPGDRLSTAIEWSALADMFLWTSRRAVRQETDPTGPLGIFASS